jgi:hypothetical protein
LKCLYNAINNAGFEVLTVAVMNSSTCWDIIPCSLGKSQPPFRRNMLPPFLGLKSKSSKKPVLLFACFILVCLFTLQPWRWKWHFPLKHQFTITKLHSVISQKTELPTNNNLSESNESTVTTFTYLLINAKTALAKNYIYYQ